jgi:hypothetical protein
MSVRGQPQLGFYAGYVVFDLNPVQGQNAICVSYVSYIKAGDGQTASGPWHQIGVNCGPLDGHMPRLGVQAQVAVTGCANVRTLPQVGTVVSCLPNGTTVTIDDGPVAVNGDTQRLWWHLQQRGWMSHELLATGSGLTSSPAVSPIPTASPSTGSEFAQLTKVTDNLGHTWLKPSPNQLVVVVPTTATVIFTTGAQDPLNRPMEYAYTTGGPPAGLLTLLCNWGGTSCALTVPDDLNLIVITAYVRVKNAPGRTPCGLQVNLGACDDELTFFLYRQNS